MNVTSDMRHFEESVDLAFYFSEEEMHADSSGGLTHKIIWKPASQSSTKPFISGFASPTPQSLQILCELAPLFNCQTLS